MNWRGVGHLGVRYLRRNRVKTALLVAAFTLVWLLPAAIALVVGKLEEQLRARAVETPLVLGHSGSALELTFNALYFTKPAIATLAKGDADEAAATGRVEAIPLYARYSAGEFRIVGTTLDYFRFREFDYTAGRAMQRLGECVIGAAVARENGIGVGDAVISSPETLFDLAGVYPLKMTVCGILEPTGSPDDRAIFVDLKTAWIIEGRGHGHVDAEAAEQDQRLATDDRGVIRLNASVLEYNEITPENIGDFHFHGDLADYPVTAVILLPGDERDQALVKGSYDSDTRLQLVAPEEEMDELFATVFSVQRIVLWILVVVGAATLAIGALVFLLSYRLRREEFRHLHHMGASAATLRALIAFEGAFVLVASLVLSAAALWLVGLVTPWVLERVVG